MRRSARKGERPSPRVGATTGSGPMRMAGGLAIVSALLASGAYANASGVCEFSANEIARNPVGVRIAQVACDEHALWHKPFIDTQGRVVRLGPMEGERDPLSDGRTAAWRRVLHYWRASGLLDRRNRHEAQKAEPSVEWAQSGAPDCAVESPDWRQKAACRTFLIDVPWSSVFVSYAMKQAGLESFATSSSHYVYLRDAVRNPKSGPYRMVALQAEKPRVGDLVCYLRERGRIYGFDDFVAYLQGNQRYLDSHCDIVVGVDVNGDSKVYAIGGNVVQGVTMRKLNLNAKGLLSLPMKKIDDDTAALAPDRGDSLNFNRQNWVTLLRLNR